MILPPGVHAPEEMPFAPVIPAAAKTELETSMRGSVMSSVKSGFGTASHAGPRG